MTARSDSGARVASERSALDAPLLDQDSDAGAQPDAGKEALADSASPEEAGAARGDAQCLPSADCCPEDPDKTAPGVCGCGQPDADYDADQLYDCQDPAPHGWLRRLTFDGSQVPGPLENFPLLVRLTDAHLGVFAASDGRDIHFVAADGSTVLDHEIERFDSARGELTAWVRLPSVERARDPVLYLAYSDGHSHRARADSVWSGHHYVWHLADELEGSEPTVLDSTGRAHATASGAMSSTNTVAGVAGNAFDFDGRDDQLIFKNDLTGDTPSTLQAWVIQREPRDGSYGSAVVMFGEQATDRARFLLSFAADTRTVRYGFYSNDGGFVAIATNVWRHLVWTWDGRRSCLYIDGQLIEGPVAHTGADTQGESGRIGSTGFDAPPYDFFHAGVLDEVRVSAVARSRAWVATEYANQRPGSTFLQAIGEPEPAR